MPTQERLDVIEANVKAILDRMDTPEQRFLTVGQASKFSSLSKETIRRLLGSGALTPLYPVRGRVAIDKKELESFMLASMRRPAQGRGQYQHEKEVRHPAASRGNC